MGPGSLVAGYDEIEDDSFRKQRTAAETVASLLFEHPADTDATSDSNEQPHEILVADLETIGVKFRNETSKQIAQKLLYALLNGGSFRPGSLDLGELSDIPNIQTIYKNVVDRFVVHGLMVRESAGRGTLYAQSPEFYSLLDRAKNPPLKRIVSKPIPRSGYFEGSPTITRLDFLRTYIAEHPGQLYALDELLQSGLLNYINTKRPRSQIAYAREVIRSLVKDGQLIPISTRVFAHADMSDADIKQAVLAHAPSIEQSIPYDDHIGLFRDLPKDSEKKRRMLERRFRRALTLHDGKTKLSSYVYNEDAVGAYLREAGRYPLLTTEGEKYLFTALEKIEDYEVSEWIREKIFKSNLRLVVSIAKTRPEIGLDLAEMISEGNIGLLHAIDMFEVEKEFKFSTYATFWIKQALGRSIDRRATLIKIPGDKMATYRAAHRKLSNSHLHWGSTASLLSAELELSEDDIAALREIHMLVVNPSLDVPVGDSGDAVFGDLIGEDDADLSQYLDNITVRKTVDQIISILRSEFDDSDVEMLLARYFSDQVPSYQAIADRHGVTGEWVRRRVSSLMHNARRTLVMDYDVDNPLLD